MGRLEEGRDRDPGLQPERTRLAWRRTTLACAVVAVLAVRQVLRRGAPAAGPAAVTALALVMLVLPGFLLTAHRRIRAMALARPPALSPGAAAVAAGCTAALAACAAALLR